VNKVATAVQLRFNVKQSPSLPDEVKERAARLAGRRMTKEGVLIIDARRYRTQEKNREDALQRLTDLIRRASMRPKIRRKSFPSRAVKQKRLEEKRRRSEVKRRRRPVPGFRDDS
jgi:ribosome-associated protein